MVKGIISWLVAFGLSLLLAEPLAMEAPEVFFWIYVIIQIAIIVLAVILLAVAGANARSLSLALGGSVLAIVACAVSFGLVLLGAWLMSQYFALDFFVVYVIMSLGAAFVAKSGSKDKD